MKFAALCLGIGGCLLLLLNGFCFLASNEVYDVRLSEQLVSWMPGSKLIPHVKTVLIYYDANARDPSVVLDTTGRIPDLVIQKRKDIELLFSSLWKGSGAFQGPPLTAKGLLYFIVDVDSTPKRGYFVATMHGSTSCFLTPIISGDSAYFRAYALFQYLKDNYPGLVGRLQD